MNAFIIIVVVYIAYIFTWLTINSVFYFFSIALKKKGILTALATLSLIGLYILNFLVGIGLFWWAISLLLNGEFLLFIALIFFGIGLISGLISYLQMPFVFITAYFANKLEDVDFNEDIATAEILDKDNKVVGKIEGNTAVSIRLAKYFVAFFALNLASMIFFPAQGRAYGVLDYLTTPATQVFGGTLFVGVPYAIYHKIRHKSFFSKDKRYFFIQVWKLNLIVFGALEIVVFLFYLFLR